MATASSDEARFALPDDLLIGAGVAAVQTEGAWNEGGKSESSTDYVLHSEKLQPMGYKEFHLMDKAANSYYRYKEDVAAAAQLKLQLFRMSISWARVLPDADSSKPNKESVDHYHDVIDEVLKYNMTPLVTMYHMDHPQSLEDEFGGWADRRMANKFGEYAEFLLREYGSKVKLWTTLNEPNVYCSYNLGLIALAEGQTMEQTREISVYPCLHHFILGHGLAYKAFREGHYEGKMGITVTTMVSQPATTSPLDVYASEAFIQLFTGMVLHPVVHGDYPQVVKNIAGHKLLQFSEEEKRMLTNSTDYIGLNVYYGISVEYKDPAVPRRPVTVPMSQLFKEANFMNVDYLNEMSDVFPNFLVAPSAMSTSLLWTWSAYKLPIMITENGVADEEPGVDDSYRAVYHSAFLRVMASTIHDFGVKVIGYCAWSLIDSVEWSAGVSRPMGLVHVDYESGSLNRTLKKSASFWQELAERRVVPLVQPSSSSAAASLGAPLLALLLALANAVLGSQLCTVGQDSKNVAKIPQNESRCTPFLML